MQPALPTLLRTLTVLRAFAAAGQALAVGMAVWLLQLPLPLPALWGGVAALAAGSLVAWLHGSRRTQVSAAQVLAWLSFDIAVLTWQLWWSGGMSNPFVSLYLVPIALTAVSLPRGWTMSCVAVCAAGYLLLAFTAPALPHAHGGPGWFDLHLWGMAVNFLLTALLFVGLLARLVDTLRLRDSELAHLREQQARNEGIVALGTQAAALAHELNTPLGTLKLLSEELRETEGTPPPPLLDNMDQVIDLCRDRIRSLVVSTDPAQQMPIGLDVWLSQTLDRWSLIHPRVNLERQVHLGHSPLLIPDVRLTHLLHALLDNAAQASDSDDTVRIELRAESTAANLSLWICDHGNGVADQRGLFSSTKPDGLGLGLALSQATVEWLGGSLQLRPRAGGGTSTEAVLPLGRLLADT